MLQEADCLVLQMVILKNIENQMLKRMLGSFGKKVLKVSQL